jgi:riboflavin kinase
MVGIILPPLHAFYHMPKTIDDLLDQAVGKVLDLFQIDHNLFERWGSSKLKRSSKRKDWKIKIRGRIVEGLQVGSTFTQLPWVRKQFIQKLNIDPHPGTLNLEIVDLKDSQNFWELKSTLGVEIIPEDPSFCSAQCYPVLINGQLKGAIVFPRVEDYPENKMELIASQNIKEVLSVKGGDVLEVEIP